MPTNAVERTAEEAKAAAHSVAEAATQGRAQTIDIRALRPERFAEGDLIAESHVV